jgi:hypothetical protein
VIPGVKRPCIDCGVLAANGSRCPRCQSALNARMDAARQGKRDHYRGDYQRRAKAVREAAEWCYWCGQGFTAANPVQADHLIAGDPRSPLVPACRKCNISRSNKAR